METVVANGEVLISCPEGFMALGEAELDALFLDNNHNRIGISDKERHMMVCLFWHRSNQILSKLANAKDVCVSTEKRLRHRMSKHGYVFEAFFERSVCGQEGRGFRHTYVLQDIDYTSEIIVF